MTSVKSTADFTTDLREIVLFALLLLACILIVCVLWQLVSQRVVIIQPLSVPAEIAKAGYSSEIVQSLIANRLLSLEDDAGNVMPASAKEEIKLDSEMPDLQVPGTTVTMRTLLQYVRQTLPIPSTTISGYVIGPADHPVLHLILSKHGETLLLETRDGPLSNFPNRIEEVADNLMEKHDPYVYASYLSDRDQEFCFTGDKPCDFADAYQIFLKIVAAGKSAPRYEWALLGLSKLDEGYKDYRHEIEMVSRLVAEYPSSWGFYNWGVALSELGCEEMAIDAFKKSVSWNESREMAYNALGRAYLALAMREKNSDPRSSHLDLKNAHDHFRKAILLKPDYQEAHVNFGISLELLGEPNGNAQARVEYRTAIEIDPTKAGLAYVRYAEMLKDPNQQNLYFSLAKWVDAHNEKCHLANPHSVFDAAGCSAGYDVRTASTFDMAVLTSMNPAVGSANQLQTSVCQNLGVSDRLAPADLLLDFAAIPP
ncbi:tetratricopeptide repeat protein [Paraburkholderia sp. JPY303]|uniref:tetratricopeptide repeat protein n=1 Tax=Paraburkholderia atlantica TaxID=2654982 RepID=UPI001591166A|nr:tetratricopeptide repeat protein [Paraburkholderia atlantica]NUY33910.1 tetratricopeptide repeat protein [Paraburkholderia atlantica]